MKRADNDLPARYAVLDRRDRWHQVLNFAGAAAQPITTYLCFASGDLPSSDGTETFVTPAGYAFVIWSLIYFACFAYGVFQALPHQRGNSLLRRIGFATAGAFLFTNLWLVAARFEIIWGTVACIVGILVCLVRAFIPVFIGTPDSAPRLSLAERWLVAPMVGIFTGWITVATVANTAAALQASGFSGIGLSDQVWAVLMLLVAGGIASEMTRLSRGDAGYTLTILWAFVAIVAANLMAGMFAPLVAFTAALCAAAVALTAFIAKNRFGNGGAPA